MPAETHSSRFGAGSPWLVASAAAVLLGSAACGGKTRSSDDGADPNSAAGVTGGNAGTEDGGGASGELPKAGPRAPAGWSLVDAGPFEFAIPPEMGYVPTRGLDSLVGRCATERVELGYDYGSYTGPLEYETEQGYAAEDVEIDGRAARVVTFHNSQTDSALTEVIAIHFPHTGPSTSDSIKLTLWADCQSTGDYELVRTIFRTIHFTPEG